MTSIRSDVTYAGQAEDVFRLLHTNNGEYAAACAMDFAKAPKFYDTFALRDAEGEEAIMQNWPYFRARASRDAIKRNRPVPVVSCWNGMGKLSVILLPMILPASPGGKLRGG